MLISLFPAFERILLFVIFVRFVSSKKLENETCFNKTIYIFDRRLELKIRKDTMPIDNRSCESFDTANQSFRSRDSDPSELEFVNLQKWLNNRQFEGCQANQNYLYLDEYFALIHLFQKNRGVSDAVVLECIATTLAGHALIWWYNNVDRISSVSHFERRLRRRFGHETEYTLVDTIANRKQRLDESLMDYIDSMINLMRRAQRTYSEEEQIKQIASGTHKKYREYLAILISNGLKSMQEFIDKAADYFDYVTRNEYKSKSTEDESSDDDEEELDEDTEVDESG